MGLIVSNKIGVFDKQKGQRNKVLPGGVWWPEIAFFGIPPISQYAHAAGQEQDGGHECQDAWASPWPSAQRVIKTRMLLNVHNYTCRWQLILTAREWLCRSNGRRWKWWMWRMLHRPGQWFAVTQKFAHVNCLRDHRKAPAVSNKVPIFEQET